MVSVSFGGSEEARTLYLIVANDALSQVSYRPTCLYILRIIEKNINLSYLNTEFSFYYLYNNHMPPSKTIAAIDLKAFFSFVECVDRGIDPWKAPLVVADKERGKNTIVLSVSPYLKSKGIPSRCRIANLPKGIDYIYAVPRMERYIEKSAEVVSIMMEFVAKEDIHVYSIDEAFIDITSYLDYYKKTPLELVKDIIGRIKERTKLQATGGIGDNFFLAKVALDIYAKHAKTGIATMHTNDVEKMLWPITDLTSIWGIGARTATKLHKIGINSMGELANSNREYIHEIFGIMGDQLIDHANGIDESDIHEKYEPESTSLSIGQVLFRDYNKKEAVTIIREMCDDLSYRMRKEGKQTELVSLYIGYSKQVMGGFSRQMSLLQRTDDTEELFNSLMEIYNHFIQDYPIRRIGINFGKLSENKYIQMDVFDNKDAKNKNHELSKAMDKLKDKYGRNVLLRASALTEESTAIERHNQIGGHRK